MSTAGSPVFECVRSARVLCSAVLSVPPCVPTLCPILLQFGCNRTSTGIAQRPLVVFCCVGAEGEGKRGNRAQVSGCQCAFAAGVRLRVCPCWATVPNCVLFSACRVAR
jgi:hypothetical protein